MEVYLLYKCRHVPGVIRMVDYFDLPLDENHSILVMERPKHCATRAEYITAHDEIEEQTSRNIFRQIVEAAQELDRISVLHGDIKV